MTYPTFDSDDELLAGYALGDLTADEQALVEQRLAQNPHLSAEVEQLQTTLNLLTLTATEIRPPAHLRDRLLQSARELPPHLSRGGWFQARSLRTLGGSIAALALVALGLSNYRLHQQLVTAQAQMQEYEGAIALLQQPENRLLSLQPVSTSQSASGSLVLVPHGDAVMLTLQNLEPLPEGMVYRMWAFANGEKFDCVTFTPDDAGEVLIKMPMEQFWSGMTTVVINIEPAQPTENMDPEMVLMGESL